VRRPQPIVEAVAETRQQMAVGLRRALNSPRAPDDIPQIHGLSGSETTIAAMGLPNDAELREYLTREYEMMVTRLNGGRSRAQRLRELAEQAADQVADDERLLKSLAELLGLSPQTSMHDLGGGMRGARLREVAVEILAKNVNPGEIVHYRDWYEMLVAEHLTVAGRNPLATFLAQISRSESVEPVGRRTGQYRLRAVA